MTTITHTQTKHDLWSDEILKLNKYMPINSLQALCEYYESHPEKFAEWRQAYEANPPPPTQDIQDIMETCEGVKLIQPGTEEYDALMEKIKEEDTVIPTIEDVSADVQEAGGSGLPSDSEQQGCSE